LSCHTVALEQPVDSLWRLKKYEVFRYGNISSQNASKLFPCRWQTRLDEKRLWHLGCCRYAVDAVEDGFEVNNHLDRAIDSEHAPIPSLLATSAVSSSLNSQGTGARLVLVIEAGDVWEVHHFACLIAFALLPSTRI